MNRPKYRRYQRKIKALQEENAELKFMLSPKVTITRPIINGFEMEIVPLKCSVQVSVYDLRQNKSIDVEQYAKHKLIECIKKNLKESGAIMFDSKKEWGCAELMATVYVLIPRRAYDEQLC